MSHDDPGNWAPVLLSIINNRSIGIVNRVAVLPQTPSTQDAAFAHARGEPGLLLLAGRQTAGRGRLGRAWVQRGDQGLAATFVLDAGRHKAEHLSLAAGLATARAVDSPDGPITKYGLRWPNDVVEPLPKPGGGRKVAGVLIEARQGLALVGIGVNVLQSDEDFPHELRARAASLRQLRSNALRIDIAGRLMVELQRALDLDARELIRAWTERDVLVGSTQEFSHNGKVVRGTVESIDPTHEIVVRTSPEMLVRLPALSTSLVRD